MRIDTSKASKGLLLSDPIGCGKTSLMKLSSHLAPHKTNYEIIPIEVDIYLLWFNGFVPFA